ncbi:MAG TPA: hypothetical protein VH878_04090 [Thermodesulfobacteriota bacterium]|jgi:hypothetical protein
MKKKQTFRIEGTYKLVRRKLSDGTIKRPPDIMGLLTYTKQFRNFNVMWKNDKGKLFSLSYIASYKLTKTKYSEKNLYLMINDQINNKGISYDLRGQNGSSPVTVTKRGIKFKLPLFNDPTLIFEANKFTAQPPGSIDFVDTWVKVK